MTDHEEFLIDTLQDLQAKLENGDEYNLLRAAGLIRQLLIDETPLVDSVNKNYKVKILFRVQKRNHKFQNKVVIDGVECETVIGVTFANPKHNDEQYIEYLKRAEFLNYNIIYFAGQDFTVLDVIKLCAHIYGGVHVGKIKEEKDLYLDWANKTVSYSDGVNCGVSTIKDIISIIVNALQPLVDEIKKKK